MVSEGTELGEGPCPEPSKGISEENSKGDGSGKPVAGLTAQKGEG